MKIFVLSKDTLIIYGLVVLILVGMFTVGTMSESVFTGAAVEENKPICRVKTEEKKVALTFDAAWNDNDTEKLLSVLDECNVKCSFFMVGGFVDRYPESIKKISEKGHEVLNHSNSHMKMTELSEEEMLEEINGCEKKVEKITGKSKKLFRAPYGDYNEKVLNLAKENGYTVIQWDVDSLDWKEYSPEEIAERVVKGTKSGSIILMHLGAKNTPEATKLIIERLKEKGYEFTLTGNLIYSDNYEINAAGEQYQK